MEYVGIDLHKKESQICLLTEAGDVMERRIRTEPPRFAEVLGGRPWARILVEASTESALGWALGGLPRPAHRRAHRGLFRRVVDTVVPLGRFPRSPRGLAEPAAGAMIVGIGCRSARSR